MSILVFSTDDAEHKTFSLLKEKLSSHKVELWPDCSSPEAITTAVVWQPPVDFFDGLTNLKHVLSIAAGVDHLLLHPGLPDNVDVVRLTDAGMAVPMSDYVLYGVLHAQRKMTSLSQAQAESIWRHDLKPSVKSRVHVGILGAGELGRITAERLVSNGYEVSCWSRSEKNIPDVTHHSGTDGLKTMLNKSKVLVCLLPLTSATTGIINEHLLSQLPKGAFVINAARGQHLVEQDLLKAIENGHITGALLDVFHEEPLPIEHAFWSNDSIIVTPHIAAPTRAEDAIGQLAENIVLLEGGKKPAGLVDRNSGY